MSELAEEWSPQTMPAMLISTASRHLERVTELRLRQLGISLSQMPVLMALKDGERLSQKELTRLAGVEQPSMAQLLARMERDGLIQRDQNPDDRRSSLVSLTQRTLQLVAPARAAFAAGNHDALAGFTVQDVELLTALLHRLIANVEGVEGPVAASTPDTKHGVSSQSE